MEPLYFLSPAFWKSPSLILLFSGSLFLVVLLRYLAFSSAYHFIVNKFFEKSPRNFSKSTPAQWKKEIMWASLSTIIFTVLSVGAFWLYQNGLTKIYTDIEDHSIGYFLFSIAILLIGYETYYYWLHRWMHHPKVFRHVHKVHHDSIHTSVFTSFSFHPLEAILQFIFLPVIVILIPIHYYALALVLMVMTVSAIINHSSVEIFPKAFLKSKIWRWLIGATHHDLHHKEFKTNFGLYFTFWDRWMKTESKNFFSRFSQVTEKRADPGK